MISMKRFLILTLAAAMGLTLGVAYSQGYNPSPGAQGQGGPAPPGPGQGPLLGPRPAMMPRAQCPTLAVAVPLNMDLILRDDALQPTPEQRQKIDDLQKKYRKLMADAASQSQAATLALIQALISEKPDAAKLPDLAAAASKADAEALKTSINFWTDLRSLLTEAQNKKLAEMLQRRLMPSLEPGMGGFGGGYGQGPRLPQGPAPQPGPGPAPGPPAPPPANP